MRIEAALRALPKIEMNRALREEQCAFDDDSSGSHRRRRRRRRACAPSARSRGKIKVVYKGSRKE